MIHRKKLFTLFSLLLIPPFLLYSAGSRKKRYKAPETTVEELGELESLEQIPKPEPVENKQRYQVKEFTITMNPEKRLSDKQLSDHKQLYIGYVNKRNEIDESLQTVDKTKSNASYSQFRGLKVAETFARNGSLLHELYFENIAVGKTMGERTQELLTKHFGSLEAFKDDAMASAIAARGWVLTCYNLDDKRIQNYLLDAHNLTVPVMTIPLLVIDTYEHAYMIDFGINRKQYLDIIWYNINWDVVEERVKTWTSL